jgi:7-carboxy-7-deazaguanine synthase (Cx14CxxC type)
MSKLYTVKEIFYTLQGEGAQSGRPAVFCRFAGCNLWSGREEDRAKAICSFCDTDFIGGNKYESASALADAIRNKWPVGGHPLVVFTGGEPLLQLDNPLIEAVHDRGFAIAVETNGTISAPNEIDWLTVSPKAKAQLVQSSGTELKLVYPQSGAEPEKYESLDFEHFFLQPMDGPQLRENIYSATEFCLRNPKWRLSLQIHKIIGLP